MPKALPVLILLAVCTLVNLPGLGIGYLSDDWAILSHLWRHGNTDHWTGPWLGLTHSFLIHRPVATGFYALELRLFGAEPFPAHLHHLLWHVFATWLCWAVARRLGARPWPAALAAGLFSFHPYMPAATGWLAGRASTLSATFCLLNLHAWLRFRQRAAASRLSYGVALLAAPLAALSREPGYLALITPLLADLLLVRPRPTLAGLVRVHAPFAFIGVALLVLRYEALGTLKGGYADGGGLMQDPGAWVTTLETFGEALLRLLGGVPHEFAAGELALPIACGVLSGLTFFVAWRRRRSTPTEPGQRALLLFTLLALHALLLLVTGPTLAASTGQRWYTVAGFFAPLFALAIDRLPRGPLIALPLLLIPGWLYGHFRVYDVLLDADHTAKELIRQIEDTFPLVSDEAPGIFVSGLPSTRAGLPCVQWGFTDAFRPPFKENPPPAPVYPIHDFMELGIEHYAPWAFHPPAELLLAIAGRAPMILRCHALPGEEIKVVGTNLATSTTPDTLKTQLATIFPHPPLEVIAPEAATTTASPPLSLPLTLRTRGLHRVEVFCFHPTVDMRYPLAIDPSRETTTLDVAALLGDFTLFHGEPETLFVLPVGYTEAEPGAPRLGRLISFRIVP